MSARKIIAGLKEALRFSKGDTSAGRIVEARTSGLTEQQRVEAFIASYEFARRMAREHGMSMRGMEQRYLRDARRR